MTQSQVSQYSSHTIPIVYSPGRFVSYSPARVDETASVKHSRTATLKRNEPDF